MPRAVIALAAVVALAAAVAIDAGASREPLSFGPLATQVTAPQVSSNWSGFAAIGPGATLGGSAGSVQFTDVTGTWVQPRVTCSLGRRDAVAFWVGIGGFSSDSQSLQQLGTEAECSGTSTTPTYAVWWEIVPAASVPVKLKLLPGDTVTAAVLVNGQKVTMSLKNVTRKTRFTKTITVSQPLDVSSAEWIAEAPANCSSFGRCRVIPLTNFGSVSFTKAAAIGNGHPGTISDPSWDATPINLVSSGFGRRFFDPVQTDGSSVGAVTGDLSADGRSFSVGWQQSVAAPQGA